MAKTERLYNLENTPKKRGDCPQCKEKNVFRYYEGLPRQFGRCERINKCVYHEKPTKKKLAEMGYIESVVVESKKEETIKIVYPTIPFCTGTIENQNSNFHRFCIEILKITPEHLKQWNCGTIEDKTAFVYQNLSKQSINIVHIEYAENGKRSEKLAPYSLKAIKGEKYSLCLFGEHLLTNRIVCLVESEKTAIIASFFYPQFDWIATGGANKLTGEKIGVLFGREIYYLGDADKAGKENSTLKKLKEYKQKYTIIELFPDRNDGYDLADAIVDGLQPEIKPSEKAEVQLKTKNEPNKREIESESMDKYGFFIRDNQYYVQQTFGKVTKEIRISNFIMKMLYTFKDGSNNAPHLFELLGEDGSTQLLEITSKDLLNLSSYCAAILSLGGYNFNGASYILKNIIESIYKSSKEAKYINTLGQYNTRDFYVFYNGLLKCNGDYLLCNEHGVVEIDNECYYIPSGRVLPSSDDENSLILEESKFKFAPGTLTLKDFAEKIYEIYDMDGLIGLCYTIATIHRDIIFKETSAFPFLFLYGPKGTGKTTFVNFFMNFFGSPQAELTSGSTQKAIERKFAQINNNIVYIKEFSSVFEEKLTDILKSAYDGVGYSRAQVSQNNKTNTTQVKSGMLVDGNYFPTGDDALFSRLIFMAWNPKFTSITKEKIQELQDELQKGNSVIFSDIYTQRIKYKDEFSNIYREVLKEIKNIASKKRIVLTEREASHISIILCSFKMSLTLLLDEKFYTLLLERLIETTQNQSKINDSIDGINVFFEAIETLKVKNTINDTFHFIREPQNGFDFLYINYSHCQEHFNRFQRDIGVKKLLSKSELKQKLEFVISKSYPYKNNEFYFQKKFNGNNGRALVFEVKTDTFEIIK
ncbi:MAG: DUF6371 domain-containing protein [Bacteroidota bacterium]